MTESEWQACTDPRPMLEFLQGRASDRKLRLFAIACCLRYWQLFKDERSRMAVTVAARFADGLASIEDLDAARIAASKVSESKVPYSASLHVAYDDASDAAWEVATFMAGIIARDPDEEQAAQAEVLRDIFGNPFRPVTIDPSWLTPTTVELTRTIYDGRAFDRLPLLADGLEQSGCLDAEILNHCRQLSEHVRGCWVVDLILGKE